MKKIFFLVIALVFVFSVAPAVAADQGLPQKAEMSFANMTDQDLASVRGGYVYQRLIINLPAFGINYDEPNPTSFPIEDPDPTDNVRIRGRYRTFVWEW